MRPDRRQQILCGKGGYAAATGCGGRRDRAAEADHEDAGWLGHLNLPQW